MTDKLVTIAKFADSTQANLAKQMLDDFEIKSIITGSNAANIYSGIPTIANIDLQVFESQAQKALEILEPKKKQEQ
ncbi:MAG: DUF2007 domain-containing protein [Planctomycetes bacterium]|nr:DUF2007 domain-containing protein [Planctomycetota bacterium]